MEGRKQKNLPSCPSLDSDFLVSKSNSSSGIRSGISTTVCLGKKSLHSAEAEKVNGSRGEIESWNSKSDVSGQKRGSIKEMFEHYPEDKMTPFHYSSSIYYGAQDVYFQTAETSYKPTVQKNGGGEDLDSALRGNWFQGSLYY